MLKEKLKDLITKEEGKDSKKKIENIVVFILIIIITVIAINAIWSGEKKEVPKQESTSGVEKQLATTEKEATVQTSQTDIQTNLESILSSIDGVGKVKVLVTYSESSQVMAMYNENNKNSQVEEKDSGGGTRTTTQNDSQKEVIYKEENGEKIPITQKVISPKIEGAIITAQGASSANVKNNIIQAVEAATRNC